MVASDTITAEGASQFECVWGTAQHIEGWLTKAQAQVLHDEAIAVRPGESVVEIGSHHGRSTVVLASAKPHDSPLVAVDPFEDPRWGGGEDALEVFSRNLERHGVAAQVSHIRSYGAEAGREWDREAVGLLFVDGAHDYPTVLRDLRAWLPHLTPTATVVMHDAYSSPGVTLAAFRQFFGAGEFAFVGSSRSLVVFRRGAQSTLERSASAGRMLMKLPWLIRNLTIKVAIINGWRSLPPLLGHTESAFPY